MAELTHEISKQNSLFLAGGTTIRNHPMDYLSIRTTLMIVEAGRK